jgi:alpha-amylase
VGESRGHAHRRAPRRAGDVCADAAHAAFAGESYQELWRQNGGADNVYVFSRGARAIAAFNNGDATAAQAVPAAAFDEGLVLDDGAQMGAAKSFVISGGNLRLSLPAKSGGVYVPRDPSSGSAVTFTVHAPMGAPVAVVGSTAELGEWDPARAVQMTATCAGADCTWSVTVKVLPVGQSMELKFLRLPATWEGGANRTFTAGTTYDGGTLH